MTDPKRLFDEGVDSFERHLLESAQIDAPRSHAFFRAMAVFGGAGGALTSSAAGAASTGAAAKLGFGALVLKWSGVGAVCVVVTAAATGAAFRAVSDPGASPAMPHAIVGQPKPSSMMPAPIVPMPAPIIPTPALVTASNSSSPVATQPRNPSTREDINPVAVTARDAPRLGGRARGLPPKLHAQPADDSTRPAATAEDRFAREVALLDQARSALYGGDSAKALALLRQREREIGAGSLRPEAIVLQVHAMVQRGDRAGASQVAKAFLSITPRGPHADRLRALLAGENP